MGNAAIAYGNLADEGTVSASAQELSLPALNLLDPHVERRWRAVATQAYFICDLGSAQMIDTIMVAGMTGTAEATVRVRVSTVDPSGDDGDAADSGVMASGDAGFDHRYGVAMLLTDGAVTGRYVRVDIVDEEAEYVEAGRLFVGVRNEFSHNFSFNWTRQWFDRSIRTKSRGGQSLIWVDNAYRVFDVTFDFIEEDEALGFVEDIDREVGQRSDVLFILNPESDNLARDSVWGMMADLTPVSQPIFDAYSKQYRIEERL